LLDPRILENLGLHRYNRYFKGRSSNLEKRMPGFIEEEAIEASHGTPNPLEPIVWAPSGNLFSYFPPEGWGQVVGFTGLQTETISKKYSKLHG
jgi:hypothetical protein